MGQVANVSFDKFSVTAAAATAVCASQAVAGAGNLTINGTQASGGVATLTGGVARRIAVVSAGAGDTTQTITLTGTDRYGNVQTEVVALNGTTPVSSVYDYVTVTKVAASAATAGNISVGTNNTASGPWRSVNNQIKPVQVGFYAHLVSGSATFSVEETMDDFNIGPNTGAGDGISIEPQSFVPPLPIGDQSTGAITGKSADTIGTLNFPCFAYRLTITAGQGTVSLQGIQAGTHE